MRLRVRDFIGTDQDIHERLEPHQLQATERTLAILAGHEPGLDRCRLYLPHGIENTGIDRHHAIMMLQIVLAVSGDHCLNGADLIPPLGKLCRQRGAHALQPLGISSRGKSMLVQGVMIAVQDQSNGVDQSTVEIEENGANVHRAKLVGSAGLRARPAARNLSYTKRPDPLGLRTRSMKPADRGTVGSAPPAKPTVREARLRPEFADLYSGIEPDRWFSAAGLAELLITRLLREGISGEE